MPRKPRQGSCTGVYHVMARGVNKKAIFHQNGDRQAYLDLLKEHVQVLGADVYHYCLMGNHLHIIVKTPDLGVLSRLVHLVQRRYAYYYCKAHGWSEQVFRRNFVCNPD